MYETFGTFLDVVIVAVLIVLTGGFIVALVSADRALREIGETIKNAVGESRKANREILERIGQLEVLLDEGIEKDIGAALRAAHNEQ